MSISISPPSRGKPIVLTLESRDRIWKVPPVNRREVLRRDQQTCQYCGSKKDLTLDHVIPRSKGGQHTWDNVVTASRLWKSRAVESAIRKSN